MSWSTFDDEPTEAPLPSIGQVEDQVESLADLLRTVYNDHYEDLRAGGDGYAGQIEDLFFELGLEL